MKEKNTFFQLVRGICICAVVLIHCKCASLTESANWEVGWSLILRQFINFPVGVFVFFSGYFTFSSKKADLCWGWREYYSRRLLRIGIPYIVWSFVYYLLYSIRSGLSLFYFAKGLVCGTCAGHIYYLLVMLQLIIITPVLTKFLLSDKYRMYPLLITPIYLIGCAIYQYGTGNFISTRHQFCTAWLTYYYLGMYFRKIGMPKWITTKRCVFAIVISLIFSILEGAYVLIQFDNISDAITQVKLSSFFFVLSIIGLIMNLSKKIKISKDNLFVQLGDASYGIYLVHLMVLGVISKGMSVLKISFPLPIHQFVQLVLTITGTCVCLRIWKMLDSGNRIGKWIGLG